MRVLWLTGLVIVLDQVSKIIVLRTMYLGQQIPLLGTWLKLTYTENPGMAFGITFGPKSLVTIFSIIATVLISFYLYKVRNGYSPYRASLALILGGAVGNIIDRVFYGALFNDGSFFVGRVVDFIHVNIWSGFIPEAIPMIGGTYVSLFPIWNVADMAIVCGVAGILIFQKVYHLHVQEQEERESGRALPGTAGIAPELVPYSAAGEASPEGVEERPDSSRTDYNSL
ncbi:MAG: signal peptidase II [Rhodothermales bacterium]